MDGDRSLRSSLDARAAKRIVSHAEALRNMDGIGAGLPANKQSWAIAYNAP
jgi:hypothetical protein